MIHHLKAFFLSIIFHLFLVVWFFSIDIVKAKETKQVIMDLNMLQEIKKVQTPPQKKEIKKPQEKKIEKKVKQEPVKKRPKPIKKIKKKKLIEKKKVVEKKIKKEIEQKPKKIEPRKEQEKPLVKNSGKKQQIKKKKPQKDTQKYQKKYMNENLLKIIAAIKKYTTYPFSARKRSIEGETLISFTLDKMGKVYDIKIENSSGYKILDNNSIDIIRSAAKIFPKPKEDIRLRIPLKYSLH
jgi:periplasmic protein TonB